MTTRLQDSFVVGNDLTGANLTNGNIVKVDAIGFIANLRAATGVLIDAVAMHV